MPCVGGVIVVIVSASVTVEAVYFTVAKLQLQYKVHALKFYLGIVLTPIKDIYLKSGGGNEDSSGLGMRLRVIWE